MSSFKLDGQDDEQVADESGEGSGDVHETYRSEEGVQSPGERDECLVGADQLLRRPETRELLSQVADEGGEPEELIDDAITQEGAPSEVGLKTVRVKRLLVAHFVDLYEAYEEEVKVQINGVVLPSPLDAILSKNNANQMCLCYQRLESTFPVQ